MKQTNAMQGSGISSCHIANNQVFPLVTLQTNPRDKKQQLATAYR
jgi:hypothetical protein